MKTCVKRCSVRKTLNRNHIPFSLAVLLIPAIVVAGCSAAPQSRPAPAWGLNGSDEWREPSELAGPRSIPQLYEVTPTGNRVYDTPEPSRSAAIAPPRITSPAPRTSRGMVIVQEGDTLYSLSRQHNTTVDEIVHINQLQTYDVKIGQELNIRYSANETR